jgi:hypothetical protein
MDVDDSASIASSTTSNVNGVNEDESSSSIQCTIGKTTEGGAGGLGVTVPRVVRFGYNRFQSQSGKWSACCRQCNKRLQDNVNVTTAFTR